MNIVILGGNSPRHKQWIRDVKTALESSFDEVRLLDYKHWATGADSADIDYEITQTAKLVEDLDDYIIVAKSVGTIIAMTGCASGVLKPHALLLMGVPLRGYEDIATELSQAIAALPNVTFLQNENDPFGTSDEVEALIKKSPPKQWRLIKSAGDTHDYVDYATILRLCNELV